MASQKHNIFRLHEHGIARGCKKVNILELTIVADVKLNEV